MPASRRTNTQVGKTYRTDDDEGMRLWEPVQERLMGVPQLAQYAPAQRLGYPQLIAPRLGQGSFRVEVTDAYGRRCAFTGEHVLPVLEAAHIRPYADGGEYLVPNGLLLRRDLHTLFDRGYITVTPDYQIEVSRRIKDEFDNGRQYYALHGQGINAPSVPAMRPARELLEWHNQRFLG